MKSQRAENDTSSFSRLPDDIALEIFKKVIDFKSLSLCKLVCKSFNRIVHNVDTIAFKAPSDWITCDKILRKKLLAFTASEPRHTEYTPCDNGVSSFLSAIQSMTKFTRLKNLCVELPPVPTLEEGIYNRCLFKWKANISIYGVDSYAFISPDRVYDDTNRLLHRDNYDVADNGEPAYKKLHFAKSEISDKCLKGDVMARYRMLLCFAIDSPLLEKVSIKDSCKRGRISLSGAKLAEVRNGLNSGSQTFKQRPRFVRGNFIQLLRHSQLGRCSMELPFSGFVMHGVCVYLAAINGLPGGNNLDCFFNIDDEGDFEDTEDAAYAEALVRVGKRIVQLQNCFRDYHARRKSRNSTSNE